MILDYVVGLTIVAVAVWWMLRKRDRNNPEVSFVVDTMNHVSNFARHAHRAKHPVESLMHIDAAIAYVSLLRGLMSDRDIKAACDQDVPQVLAFLTRLQDDALVRIAIECPRLTKASASAPAASLPDSSRGHARSGQSSRSGRP